MRRETQLSVGYDEPERLNDLASRRQLPTSTIPPQALLGDGIHRQSQAEYDEVRRHEQKKGNKKLTHDMIAIWWEQAWGYSSAARWFWALYVRVR